MCRAFAALNIRVSSLAFSTSPTRSSALFSLASLTFWFISLSISFLDFLNCLFFSGSLQFSIWSLISFCSFDILSRSGSDIWWLFTFFLYPLWASATHLIMSLSFSHLFSCCAATYALLSVSCLICSLYLSWFSSFCLNCLMSNPFWLVLGIFWW